jgi:hypothetical protein
VTLRSSCRHICKEHECYKQQKPLHLPKVVTTVARVMLTRFFRGLAGTAPALLAKGRKNLWKTKKGMQMDSKDASRCSCILWLVAAILIRAALKQGKQVDIRTTNIPDQEGVARAEASICVHRVGAEMVQVLYSSSGARTSLLRQPKCTEANDTAGLWNWRKESRDGCT